MITAALTSMVRIRRFEERVRREFSRGDMPGFVHTYVGAEAVAVGVCAHLSADDLITSTHRGHGHCLAKGVEIAPMVAELFGRETGLCHGRGGSMHIADFGRGVLGANAIVGGGIGLAVGAALASDVLADGRVAVSFFGDGAGNEGIFHESLNLAAIWRLPVVFVCENNGWAESTPVSYATAVPTVAERAAAYAMPGVRVDGTDFEAMYAAAGDAVARARAGDGPTLIEAVIPRHTGHFLGDPERYRSRDDRSAARDDDPIRRLAAAARDRGIDADAIVAAAETTTTAELDAAYAAAAMRPGRSPRRWDAMSTSLDAPTVELSFVESVGRTLAHVMRADERVIVLGEDIAGGAGQGPPLEGAMGGSFGVTKGLLEEFGRRRVRDTPISEAAITAAAVGAAMAGLRPIVDLMWASFTPYCMDQIVNQAAKLRYMSGGQATIPLVLRMAAGAGVRAAAQHSDTLYPFFTHVPGLKTVVPATPAEAQGLLLAAVADDNPVIFIEHMALYRERGPVPVEPVAMPLGKLGVLRAGRDVTIACVGQAAVPALAAADELSAAGIDCEVLSLRTLQPLDVDGLVAAVGATRRLVVVEEAPPRCSVAADVAAVVGEALFGQLAAPVRRVNAAATPVPFSPPLEDAYLPSTARIVAACRSVM